VLPVVEVESTESPLWRPGTASESLLPTGDTYADVAPCCAVKGFS